MEQQSAQQTVCISALETNLDALEAGLAVARELGMFTVLNPAPARTVGSAILQYVDLIVPNETETLALTGITPDTEENVCRIYQHFTQLGVSQMIITLGKRGCVHASGENLVWHAAKTVEAVDTTSAGDTFIGAVCARLSVGEKIEDAIDYAAICSAITVSRRGAAISIPTATEVEQYLHNAK